MGRFYSDEVEQALLLLYFQPDESKYPEAVRLLERAVEREEPDAFYYLARCYAWGDGNVEDDEEKAIRLSKRGIELGSDLCVLGADRFDGLNGDLAAAMHHSLADSLEIVKQKALAGDPMAQYAVALFYFWGDIIEIAPPRPGQSIDAYEAANAVESHKWYRMAADQGCIPAFRNVFVSLCDGVNGTRQDKRAALAYAEQMKARVNFDGKLYRNIAGEYEELGNGRMAAQWYEEGLMRLGNADCANDLGNLYACGEAGMPQNWQLAVKYFQIGADMGEPYAQCSLALAYMNGNGVPQDDVRAFQYYSAAAGQGHTKAQGRLAQYYYEGRGGAPVDYREAASWGNRAAAAGDYNGKLYLGKCYLYGNAGMTNPELAMRLFREAAESGRCPAAYRELGYMFDKGIGVSEDVNQAAGNYKLAADKGYAPANEDLARFKKSLLGGWKRI